MIEAPADGDPIHPRLSFYVFLAIRTAQLQHGLRHGDYERYRKYCTAKLERMRKNLGATNRRSLRGGRPPAKIPELHALNDPRALQIPLMVCERAWAFGMQKKGEQTAMGHSLKRRGTMLRKLSQAVKASNALISLCDKKCDPRSCLEATGYSEFIKGVSSMETGRKWKQALQHFTQSKTILERLIKVSDVEVQSIFIQAIEEMEPNIRFCRYELQKLDQSDDLEPFDDLQERLQQLEIKNVKETETVSALSITWCQNQYPVKNERLSELLQTAQKFEKQLSASNQDHASFITLYEKAISAYMDMENNIKKALAAGGGVSVFAGEDLEQLQMAVGGKLVRHSIEKAKLQIHRNQELFQEILTKSLSSKKQQALKSRAETLVHLCDSIIGLILEQSELGMELGGAHGENLMEECTILASVYQARRCFYVAHVFQSNGSLPESYALFHRCIERCDIGLSHISESMEDTLRQSFTADMTTLRKRADAFRCCVLAEMTGVSLLEVREAGSKLEGMKIEEEETEIKGKKAKKAAIPAQKYMAENLQLWESFIGAERKNIRLFKIPPSLSTIPVRPFILDSAPNHIKKPELKHRLPPEQDKGVFSKFFQYTGWK